MKLISIAIIVYLSISFNDALRKKIIKRPTKTGKLLLKRPADGIVASNIIQPYLLDYRPCQCGVHQEARIVGGTDAKINNFPFIASIQKKSDGTHFCGGSLINDKYVLSAAHCFPQTNAEEIQIQLGIDYRSPGDTTNVYGASKIKLHPDYESDTVNMDIALIKLKNTVETYSVSIKPVCLPFAQESIKNGALAVAAGWGATNELHGNYDDLPRQLQKVELSLISSPTCGNDFRYEKKAITDYMICANDEGKDACQGDSGGPLVVKGIKSHWKLVGITSWGIGCARRGYPGVFTKVSKLLPWIYTNSQSGKFCDNK